MKLWYDKHSDKGIYELYITEESFETKLPIVTLYQGISDESPHDMCYKVTVSIGYIYYCSKELSAKNLDEAKAEAESLLHDKLNETIKKYKTTLAECEGLLLSFIPDLISEGERGV